MSKKINNIRPGNFSSIILSVILTSLLLYKVVPNFCHAQTKSKLQKTVSALQKPKQMMKTVNPLPCSDQVVLLSPEDAQMVSDTLPTLSWEYDVMNCPNAASNTDTLTLINKEGTMQGTGKTIIKQNKPYNYFYSPYPNNTSFTWQLKIAHVEKGQTPLDALNGNTLLTDVSLTNAIIQKWTTVPNPAAITCSFNFSQIPNPPAFHNLDTYAWKVVLHPVNTKLNTNYKLVESNIGTFTINTWYFLVEDIRKLLLANQNIDLGTPVDDWSGGNGIPYFQVLNNKSAYNNSIEMQADGNIYISCSPENLPIRYNSYYAYDHDGENWAWDNTTPAPNGTELKPFRLLHLETKEKRKYTLLQYVGKNLFNIRDEKNFKVNGDSTFAQIQENNKHLENWKPPQVVYPAGSGLSPQPRWFVLKLPAKAHIWGDPLYDWEIFLNNQNPEENEESNLFKHQTTLFPNTMAYSLNDYTVLSTWSFLSMFAGFPVISRGGCGALNDGVYPTNADKLMGGCPEWQTILPINDPQHDYGQKNDGHGNPYNWDMIMSGTQLIQDPNPTLKNLAWNGHPNNDDRDNTIPWTSSYVEGIVTNSWLSGGDYAGDHSGLPDGYWTGSLPYLYAWNGCGMFNTEGGMCSDWCFFINTDPEYNFMRGGVYGQGDEDEIDFLPCEIETWCIPTDYRPEPGDRITAAGRWIVDVGHTSFHTELHPIEMFVSTHIADKKSEAKVVVTGAWNGGTMRFEVWPPPRSTASDGFRYSRNDDIVQNICMRETPEPQDNPNHLLVVVNAEPQQNHTGGLGDVTYDSTRRIATKYSLWWNTPRNIRPSNSMAASHFNSGIIQNEPMRSMMDPAKVNLITGGSSHGTALKKGITENTPLKPLTGSYVKGKISNSTLDRLNGGESLNLGDTLFSSKGQYCIVLQGDGNFVLYKDSNVELWSAGLQCLPVQQVLMQEDGNLVLLAPDGSAAWSSKTDNHPGAYLKVQDDGNLVIYGPDDVAIWSTGTQGN
ncbi:MAG: hypothetical protein ACHQQQ_04755 [Bacteroidota bacterium]